MTWTMRVRGAPPAVIVREYFCADHGRYELSLDTREGELELERQACPSCGRHAELVVSGVLYKPQRGAVTQGKVAEKPHALSLDTSALGDGMPSNEFKKKRAKQWNEDRRRRVKALLK